MSDALWTPSQERIIRANMTEFLRYVEERGGPPVPDYSPDSYWELHWDPRFATPVPYD